MLEALADRISRYLVSIDAAKEIDREIIALGLFRILSNILQYTILLITALLVRRVAGVMLFTLMFGALKRYAGGTHMSRFWMCLTGSTVLVHTASFLCCLVPLPLAGYIACAASTAALALVLIRAPVIHPNNPKTPKRKKQLRKVSIYVALAEWATVTACVLFAPEWAKLWILCGAAGGFASAVTLILPMPREKGGASGENAV